MTVTVAIAQVTARAFEAERNREMTVAVAEDAFDRGAHLVVLPELIVPGYALEERGLEEAAEPLQGPTLAAWRRLAARRKGYLAGGFCERAEGRLFNSAVLVGPDGLALHYRKLHLFDREKHIFAPGNLGLPIAQTAIGVLGLCVCYDLRFVEVARALSLRGAELIAVPTAWVAGFDQQRWDSEGFCPQARGVALQANLDQVFIACASQAGEGEGFEFLGSSIVVDAYGKPAAGPLSGCAEELSFATIDLEDARRAQRRSGNVSPRADRRTDVYGLWFEGTRL